MARFLTNRMIGEVTPQDEAIAKEVLRTKVLVGMLSNKTESLRRFRLYFGWDHKVRELAKLGDYEEKLLHWGWPQKKSTRQFRKVVILGIY